MFFVISFPKSGRTWLGIMLDDLGVRARYSHDGSDHRLRLPLSELHADKAQYAGATVLLMVRDPRDTAVSGYFQVTRRLGIAVPSMSDLIRSDCHGIKKICHFHLQWFDAAPGMKRFAILRYEQLHATPGPAVAAVAAFAGISVNCDIANRVAENRTFERMRAAEASGELGAKYGNVVRARNVDDPDSFKVRRGKVGGYNDYFSEADSAYCDAVLTEIDYWPRLLAATARWGLPIPDNTI
jgi:hypothetical protein